MIEKYLNNRFYYFIFFSIFPRLSNSFYLFNHLIFFLINFIILPLFFYLIVYIKKKSKSTYRKKPFKKNLFIYGTSFGFGYLFKRYSLDNNSLTFDENFKILIPFGLILIPLFLSLFFSIFNNNWSLI